MFVTQWQRKTSMKSSASKRGLSVLLLFRPCSLASEPLINYFFVSHVGTLMFFAIYIKDLFQSQRVDLSTFPFDV